MFTRITRLRPSSRVSFVLTFLCALWLALPGSSSAQIEPWTYGLGIRVPNEDGPCTDTYLCDANSGVGDTGTYDIEIYAGDFINLLEIDGLRFSLATPSDWTVISFELCGATIANGDPYDIATGVELTTDSCWDGFGPVLVLRMDCPSPGRATMKGMNGGHAPERRYCSDDVWVEGSDDQIVNVGDFCGRLNRNGPCDYCIRELSVWGFDPPSLSWTLVPGAAETTLLTVSGRTGTGCGLLPECGGNYYPDADCFGDISDTPRWMTATYLYSETSYRHYYELAVDTEGLPPGQFEDRIWASPGCPTCVGTCMDVRLTVASPADVTTSSHTQRLSLDVDRNPSCGSIDYSLRMPAQGRVRVSLFDATGALIETLLDESREAGTHSISATPTNRLPHGVYFLRAMTETEVAREKVTQLGN
ncbi:MAG: hypothetical protein KDA27_10720 [Candidatus Eisenbacteria bacterium]|uniref:T9SS type A sorting domain-containing protein n=1 Tax=Eiseniibacteriota bacterium TaxID=2212470 RepID=A0A956NCJ6_UNCEI|nr:hypothetical protein [Candidatus Eisenbacteria bacterium]